MSKNNKTWLYEFEAKETITKADGSKDTVTKNFGILKPNRRMREDGELFYAAETSRFAKAGVLPKAAWGTILSNGGGSISDKEREVYGNLLIKFRDASFDLQSILIKNDNERTDSEKKRSDELIQELDFIRKEIQSFEASQISIFENTAEAKARNRTILWWVLYLAYKKNDDGNYAEIFSGETFNDKLDSYDLLEDIEKEGSFLLSVIRRFTYLITLWFLGKSETPEDFKEFDMSFLEESTPKQEVEEIVVETKVEEKINTKTNEVIEVKEEVKVEEKKEPESTPSA